MRKQAVTPIAFRSLALAAVALAVLAAVASASGGATPVAHAVPVTGITVDGRLGDWPAEMAAWPIDGVSTYPYGPFAGTPDGPEDFAGRFHAGYDAAAGRLYLAVVVEDDEAGSGKQQDGCVLSLVEGMRGAADDGSDARYLLAAGRGATLHAFPAGAVPPGLAGASRRLGTTAVYKWSLPLAAARGDSVGLWLGVNDGDGGERGGYVSWGNPEGRTPGVLVLGGDDLAAAVRVDPWGPSDPGVVLTGTVRGPESEPVDGVALAIRGDGRVAAAAKSGVDGGFAVDLLPGAYVIEVVPGFGFEAGAATRVAVAQDTAVTLRVERLRVPDELRRSALRYGRLRTYSDSVQFRDETRRGAMRGGGTRERTLVFARPDRIRLTASNSRRGETLIVCDGDSLTARNDGNGDTEYLRREIAQDLSSALTFTALSTGASVDGLVLRLLLSEDPMAALTRGTRQIRPAGEDRIDDAAMWVFDLERFGWAGPGPRRSDAVGDTFVMRVWVGQADQLIHRVVIEEAVPEDTMARAEAGTRRREWRHRAIRVDEAPAAGAFSLAIPAGARRVESFGAP